MKWVKFAALFVVTLVVGYWIYDRDVLKLIGHVLLSVIAVVLIWTAIWRIDEGDRWFVPMTFSFMGGMFFSQLLRLMV